MQLRNGIGNGGEITFVEVGQPPYPVLGDRLSYCSIELLNARLDGTLTQSWENPGSGTSVSASKGYRALAQTLEFL